jgi:DNA-binding CsgD family transcriptional regulator
MAKGKRRSHKGRSSFEPPKTDQSQKGSKPTGQTEKSEGLETGRTQPYQDNSPEPPLWERFPLMLPLRPYCGNDLQHGVVIRSRIHALKYENIQPNVPWTARWLVFDIDRADAAVAYEAAGYLPPNVIVRNPSNGHAHYLYAINVPVAVRGQARQRPLKYLADVQAGMRRRLGADPNYSGFLCKNPFHARWQTIWLAPQPYTLEELRAELTPEDLRSSSSPYEACGFGRNVTLFDGLRRIAYRLALRCMMTGNAKAGFRSELEHRAFELNAEFPLPLSTAEVRGIVKSIARWTWTQFSPEQFSKLQAARRSSVKVKRQAALERLAASEGVSFASTRDLAERLGCSPRTVRRYRAQSRRRYEARSLARRRPWITQGISRATWYRRRGRRKA